MNVVFWASTKEREQILGRAFIAGVHELGDTGRVRQKAAFKRPVGDVGVVIGIKDRRIIAAYQAKRKPWVYMDKGFFRVSRGDHRGFLKQKYWKLSVNNFQPLDYLMDNTKPERWAQIIKDHPSLTPRPFRKDGEHIILMGPSDKYTTFFGMPHPTEWCSKVIEKLRRYTDRPITYRPKHSWKEATPIPGTFFSRYPRRLKNDLEGAWCLITHGSNSSAEAIVAGIPVIALGPAITWPISDHELGSIESVKVPTEQERLEWLNAMSYCMWTVEELESGEAWDEIKRYM